MSINIKKAKRTRKPREEKTKLTITREQAERMAVAFKEWNEAPPSPILKEATSAFAGITRTFAAPVVARSSTPPMPAPEEWPKIIDYVTPLPPQPGPGRGRFNQPLVGEKSIPAPPLTTGAGTIKRR